MTQSKFDHLSEIENLLIKLQGAIDTMSQTEACETDNAVAYLHGQMFDHVRDLRKAFEAVWGLLQDREQSRTEEGNIVWLN